MSRPVDTANSAVALVGLIHDAATDQGLELAHSLGRLRRLVNQLAGSIDCATDLIPHLKGRLPAPAPAKREPGSVTVPRTLWLDLGRALGAARRASLRIDDRQPADAGPAARPRSVEQLERAWQIVVDVSNGQDLVG